MNENKVKLAAIEDLSIREPEEGKTYIVFRSVDPKSINSKYVICIYRSCSWIPYLLADFHWRDITGIPVTKDDKWINISDAFESFEEPVEPSCDDPIQNRLAGIEKTIEELAKKFEEFKKSESPAQYPLQPIQPYTPYIPTPIYPDPMQPQVWYSIGTGAPCLKPGEITCTYNYVPSQENK